MIILAYRKLPGVLYFVAFCFTPPARLAGIGLSRSRHILLSIFVGWLSMAGIHFFHLVDSMHPVLPRVLCTLQKFGTIQEESLWRSRRLQR